MSSIVFPVLPNAFELILLIPLNQNSLNVISANELSSNVNSVSFSLSPEFEKSIRILSNSFSVSFRFLLNELNVFLIVFNGTSLHSISNLIRWEKLIY